ncbi:monovalent cation/H(+) antiporter subunit G [archaeon]|nr:monovalent cation/H(+) antiporter subunit G [archaeon]
MIELVYFALGIGLLFNLLGVLGLHRFPDAYTRLHASTQCVTFGALFIGAGVIIYSFSRLSNHLFLFESTEVFMAPQSIILIIHTIIAIAVLLVANATESHAIAKAAYKTGLKPGAIDALEAKK